MRGHGVSSALVATIVGLACVAHGEYVPDQAIVEMKTGFSIDEIVEDYGVAVERSIPSRRLHLLALGDGWDEQAFADTIKNDYRVQDAALNHEPELAQGSSQGFFVDAIETQYTGQYAWEVIDVEAAREASTGLGVLVAVLDTGVDPTHCQFDRTPFRAGYDFVDETENTDDVGNGVDDDGDGEIDELVGHGTAMTGLIVSVAPRAEILPVRVLGSDGTCTTFRLLQGIVFALEQGADVINISLGSPLEVDLLNDLLSECADTRTIVVGAAGNRDRGEPAEYPAAHDAVLAVAATGSDDVKAESSNYGQHVFICAPGGAVTSTLPGDRYGTAEGTSLATALVTGAAALAKSLDPELDIDALEGLLADAAEDVDARNPDHEGLLGVGRLDLTTAFDELREHDACDLDDDGRVDFDDLLLLLGAWGPCPDDCRPDINDDGHVGFPDLLLLLANWT